MPRTVASRFEVGPLVGGGATGSVYAGMDTLTGQKVAIKALREELVASIPDLVERFRREGEALRRLNHPNIVKVLATVEEGIITISSWNMSAAAPCPPCFSASLN